MQVFDVTARYRRVVQPRDYESAEAELIFKSTVEHGDNFAEVSAELLGRAKMQVNYALGIAAPTVAETATVVPTSEQVEAAAAEQPVEDDAPKPKPRGRGKAKPKAKANSVEVPTEAPAIPGMDMDKLGAAAGPEAAETGLADDFDTAGEEAEPEVAPVDVEILNENLQASASKAAKKYGSKAVKDLMAKTFKVAKLGDLEQDQRRKFLNALETLK